MSFIFLRNIAFFSQIPSIKIDFHESDWQLFGKITSCVSNSRLSFNKQSFAKKFDRKIEKKKIFVIWLWISKVNWKYFKHLHLGDEAWTRKVLNFPPWLPPLGDLFSQQSAMTWLKVYFMNGKSPTVEKTESLIPLSHCRYFDCGDEMWSDMTKLFNNYWPGTSYSWVATAKEYE